MAQPPNTSDAFLREVDDELRRDQLAAAWRKWGRIGVVAVAVALLLFGGWLFWNARAERKAGEQGEQLQAAYDDLTAGQAASADATLQQLATDGAPGYRALARLAQADQLLAAKDVKGAAAGYAAIVADGSLGQPFRDLALLRQTLAEFDTLPPATVVSRMQPLAVPGNPWFGSAGELTAISYVRQGRRDLAGRLFGQLARAEDVPDSIRQRAVQMAGAMGVDAAAAGPSSGVTPRP